MSDDLEDLRALLGGRLPPLHRVKRDQIRQERLARVPILMAIVECGLPVEAIELVLSGRLCLEPLLGGECRPARPGGGPASLSTEHLPAVEL